MFYIFITIVLDTTSPRQQLHPCPAPLDIQGVRLIFGDEILTELELGDNLRMNDGMIGVEVMASHLSNPAEMRQCAGVF